MKFFDMDTDSQMKQIDVIKIMLEKVESLKLDEKALEEFLNRKDRDGESAVTNITYNICSMQNKNTNGFANSLKFTNSKFAIWTFFGLSSKTSHINWKFTFCRLFLQ